MLGYLKTINRVVLHFRTGALIYFRDDSVKTFLKIFGFILVTYSSVHSASPVDDYENYQNVLSRFFDETKTSQSEHRSIVKKKYKAFKTKYKNKETTTVDVTGCSSRTVIALFRKIFKHKSKKMNNQEFWNPEKSTYKGIPYTNFVDQFPTTFEVDSKKYKLKFISTKKQPGNGALYGLTNPSTADPYMPNSYSDKSVFSYLQNCSGQQRTSIQKFLKARQRGKPAEIDDELKQFSNGLHLLFCFEVSRRLAIGDKFRSLPVLFSVHSLLKDFSDLDKVKRCFSEIFATDKRELNLREFIESQKMSADGKTLRNRLRMFHADDEDSGEDELENYS